MTKRQAIHEFVARASALSTHGGPLAKEKFPVDLRTIAAFFTVAENHPDKTQVGKAVPLRYSTETTATNILKPLVKRGWVTHHPGKDMYHVATYTLTPKGLEIYLDLIQ